MLVELEGQRWFGAHQIAEIADDKRIRTATEVGYICPVKLGVSLDECGGLKDHLAVAPVHVRIALLILIRKKVERNDPESA